METEVGKADKQCTQVLLAEPFAPLRDVSLVHPDCLGDLPRRHAIGREQDDRRALCVPDRGGLPRRASLQHGSFLVAYFNDRCFSHSPCSAWN
jgi:hypothetical protein